MTLVEAGPQRERRARRGRFQFSLATALAVVTGVSVALSLAVWHWTFGLMAAIVLVGGGWAAAARRAGNRRLAYCLAASALGVVGHLVLGGLFFPLTDPFPFSGWDSSFVREVWLRPLPVLWMSMATAVAAMLIRRLRNAPVKASLVGVYLTAMIFPVLWGVFTLFSPVVPSVGPIRFAPEEGFGIALLGLLFGPLLATITLPVIWPTAMLFGVILRWIDPVPEVWAAPGRDGWTVVHRDAEASESEPSARSP